MTKRPPLLGYNHNVRHAGHLFHVQTEDSGVARLVIFTHAFVEGTILASLRSTYGADEPEASVQKRMQDQHKTMLRRVRDGEFDQHPEVLARAGQGTATAGDSTKATAGSDAHGAPRPAAKGDAKPDTKPDAKSPQVAAAKHDAKPEAKADAKPEGKSDAGALAARLGIKSGATATVAPPIAADAAAKPAAPAPKVLELDADSDEDLTIDIVANEPTDEEDEEAMLSKATPLPIAVPLQDSAEHVPVAPVYPPSPNPLFQVTVGGQRPGRVSRMTRPLYMRPLHTGTLRMRSTSEGIVVVGPPQMRATARRPAASGFATNASGKDALRTTLSQAHPTIPGAVSAIGLAVAGDVQVIDDVLLAFLRREAARSL